MKKLLLTAAAGLLLLVPGQALASPLVTSDVPLTSKHYQYIEKLEAMGFITDMPSNTKPYSRLAVARMLAKVNPEGMQPYLRVYYDELVDNLSDEIAYIIVHEPLSNTQLIDKKHKKKAEKFHQEYYADKYNTWVADKVKVAGSKHFPSNVKLRKIKLELSGQQMDRKDYTYRRTDASYQPLHGQNQGYRYGEGFNAVGSVEISGSLNNDLALNVTPRFSFNKDDKGKASLQEGYMRTHLGNLSLTAGKQALNWGAPSRNPGFSISDNGPSHTYVKLGLLEPLSIDEGALRFLGKVDFHLFWSKLENNRTKRYAKLHPLAKKNMEYDQGNLIGMRMEITPNDTFTLGLQRVGMVSKFGKNWLWTTNDGVTQDNKDFGNDQAGIDWRWKFPGVQFYGAIYGEDGTFDIGSGFLSNKAQYYGLYFPQLAKDGSWDLRLEHKKTSNAWYTHGGCFENGWSYHGDIMGDPMGNRANRQDVELNNYLKNGDILSFRFMNMATDRLQENNQQIREYQIAYSHKLSQAMHLDTSLGFADIKNPENTKGKNEKSKYMALGLRWEL